MNAFSPISYTHNIIRSRNKHAVFYPSWMQGGGRVGPKRVETIVDKIGIQSEREKRTRTARSIIHGWVVGPCRLSSAKNSWRVLWSNCGKTRDHPHSRA